MQIPLWLLCFSLIILENSERRDKRGGERQANVDEKLLKLQKHCSLASGVEGRDHIFMSQHNGIL